MFFCILQNVFKFCLPEKIMIQGSQLGSELCKLSRTWNTLIVRAFLCKQLHLSKVLLITSYAQYFTSICHSFYSLITRHFFLIFAFLTPSHLFFFGSWDLNQFNLEIKWVVSWSKVSGVSNCDSLWFTYFLHRNNSSKNSEGCCIKWVKPHQFLRISYSMQ